MTKDKIKQIGTKDKTGLRNNITELLEEARKNNIQAIGLCYQTKDGREKMYWNGDEETVYYIFGLLQFDILHGREVVRTANYDHINPDDEGDKE